MEPLDTALIASLQQALRRETQEPSALRMAMLGLIFLVQDDASPAQRAYLDFLLTDFPPVSGVFLEDTHPFLEGHCITRRWIVDHTELLLHEAFLWQLVDRWNGPARNN